MAIGHVGRGARGEETCTASEKADHCGGQDVLQYFFYVNFVLQFLGIVRAAFFVGILVHCFLFPIIFPGAFATQISEGSNYVSQRYDNYTFLGGEIKSSLPELERGKIIQF